MFISIYKYVQIQDFLLSLKNWSSHPELAAVLVWEGGLETSAKGQCSPKYCYQASLSCTILKIWTIDTVDTLQCCSPQQGTSSRNCWVGSQYYTKNTRIIMSGKALKSQLSDTMLNGEQLSSETDNSNFADFKPGRPESYKIEFKKNRDTLEMKGEVRRFFLFIFHTVHHIFIWQIQCQSESSGHFLDLKPRRPKINRSVILIERPHIDWRWYSNRIADEMRVEGNFSDETESRNMKDFKPVRPIINRWGSRTKSVNV